MSPGRGDGDSPGACLHEPERVESLARDTPSESSQLAPEKVAESMSPGVLLAQEIRRGGQPLEFH